MAQFDERTTQFPEDGTLVAQAGQKVLDVVEEGTMRLRVFRRVPVDLLGGARARLEAGLKVVLRTVQDGSNLAQHLVVRLYDAGSGRRGFHGVFHFIGTLGVTSSGKNSINRSSIGQSMSVL